MEIIKSVNHQIFKFLLKAIFLLFLVVIVDQISGRILRKFYFSQESGAAFRTTYAMDSTTADILIFGSSRANHHYVPDVFEKDLNMSFYNTGRDGNFILFNYAIFKTIINRYTPKIVIFDLNPNEFYFNQESYERLSSLLPYYSNHNEIKDIVHLRSPFEKIKLLSAIYPFNSSLLTIGIGNLDINKARKSDRKGFIPLNGVMRDIKLDTIIVPSGPLDLNKIHALDSICMMCSKRNIQLTFCHSPIYGIILKNKADTLIQRLTNIHHIRYIDLSNDSRILSKPHLFQDIEHLNDKGAFFYSTIVLEELSHCLNKKKFP